MSKERGKIHVDVEMQFDIPIVPNYLRREDGEMRDIAEFSKGDLIRIANAWKSELLEHAERRKVKVRAHAESSITFPFPVSAA